MNTIEIKTSKEKISVVCDEMKSPSETNTHVLLVDEISAMNNNKTVTVLTDGVVSKSTILPEVVVKPKNDKQRCEVTLQRVKENMAGSDVFIGARHSKYTWWRHRY